MNMSDRIAIMNRGRIEQVGPPAEIYERPANIFIGRFLGEANLVEGRVEDVADGVATLRVADDLTLRAHVCAGGAVGASASLFVRPERVALGTGAVGEGDPAVNRAVGQVRRISFLGNIVRYAVEIAPAALIIVDVQNTGSRRIAAGERVTVSWPVADSLVLVG